MSDNKRMVMVIDLERCIGCQTCVVGCHIDHKLKDGAYWGHLEPLKGDKLYVPVKDFDSLLLGFLPKMCNHCTKPRCVEVCPTGAMSKRADGVVFIDEAKCIGCGSCLEECPYKAPVLDVEKEKMTKCNMCFDRLDHGEVPLCVQSCPAAARLCGDAGDPKSRVSGLILSRKGYQDEPENGTIPSVYYLPLRKTVF